MHLSTTLCKNVSTPPEIELEAYFWPECVKVCFNSNKVTEAIFDILRISIMAAIFWGNIAIFPQHFQFFC